MRNRPAPFACPRCGSGEDFARKGKRTRKRKLHTVAGTVELVCWHVGCRDCGRVFAPLLLMPGLSGKRRTDRLTVDLAGLSTQVSFARAGQISRELAGTSATAAQAHNAVADMAVLLTGQDGTPGPGHPAPDVVALDGTGARAGANRNGVGAHLAVGLTGRPGPAGRRRAHTHLPGLTVDEDWAALGRQVAGLPAPALVVPGRGGRDHRTGPGPVAADADPALLVASAPRAAQCLLRRRRRQPPRQPPLGPPHERAAGRAAA